jgi:hypothetical protein
VAANCDEGGQAVPRHWWIILGASNPVERKKEVRAKVEAKKGKGSLRGFWKAEGEEKFYAVVRAEELEDILKRDIRAIDAFPMEDVPES